MCCLQRASSFLGVLPSDLLPQHSIARSGTLFVNTDPLRIGFALVSCSFPIMFLHPILFRLLWITSLYSLYTIVHQTQLHRLGLQLDTNARTYYSGLRQILLSLRLTWIEVILRKRSSFSWLHRPPTSWIPKCSSRSLDLYIRCREAEGNATSANIKGKSLCY
jgi:hypothetical protein